MYDYNILTITTSRLLDSLKNFSEKEEEVELRLANAYCQSALFNSNHFNSYFRTEVGYMLTTELHDFYERILFDISEDDTGELQIYIKHLDKLVRAMRFDGIKEDSKIRRGFHYSRFPSHPAGPEQAERLLKTMREINEELKEQ